MNVADFEKATVGPGIDLYVHPTRKFKTISIKVYVHQPLGPEATRLALLPFVLRRGCRRFQTQRKIVVFLEDLYGASMNADILKLGERQVLFFQLDVVNDRYVPKRIHALRKALEFLGLLLTRPVTEKGGLKADFVKQEKENLARLIESLINDRMTYAVERCIEEMCAGEPYARYEYGKVGEIAPITPGSLAKIHARVLEEAPIEIFIVGDVAPRAAADIAARAFRIRGRRPQILPAAVTKPANGRREVVERMDVEQGKLVLGGRTGVRWSDDDVFPLVYYNGLLGAFPHSKLFVNVREREGLAYSASSSLDHTKGLVFITAGIDFAKYGDCVRVIDEQMADLAAGKFSDEDFEKTRKTVVDRVRSREDNAGAKIGSFAEMLLNGRPLTPQQLIARLEKVTREDVVRVAARVKIQTVYFLTRPS